MEGEGEYFLIETLKGMLIGRFQCRFGRTDFYEGVVISLGF